MTLTLHQSICAFIHHCFHSSSYMETMPPFVRVILPSELENDCKYPRRESYVPGGALWAIVLSVPCLLSLLAWGACNDCNDALEVSVT
ncbi:hypothetical protein RR48_01449 [Papilio machaon]|uniref:Uncharacterized protein n=1 Tax=Papilio machaon TaxID=76193 RepID=A0A0N0PDR4_PAPMA|nr:hypothetical protein RR48_01449 [Papilio machaon]